MKFRSIARRAVAPRNLAATLVLTIAVGGVAYAAIGSSQIMNNSLTSADIKNNSLSSLDVKNESLTGADVKNKTLRGRDLADNSVTGNQVDESTLGKVPSATAADSAMNADKLDNMDSTEFVQTKNLAHVWKGMTAGEADATLVTHGTVSIKMSCTNGGGNDTMRIYAATSVNGAVLESENDDADPLDTTTVPTSAEITSSVTSGENTASTDTGYDETGWVASADGAYLITMLEGSSSQVMNKFGKDCLYGGTFILKTAS